MQKNCFLLCLLLMFLFLSPVYATGFFRMKTSVPANYAKNVPLNTHIYVVFQKRISKPSVPRDLLYEGTHRKLVLTDITFNDLEDTIYIHPKEPLKLGTFYYIDLSSIVAEGGFLLNQKANFLVFTTEGGKFHCIPYANPAELTMNPGGFTDIVYSFIETGGGLAEIMRCHLVYTDQDGRELLKSTEDMKLIIENKKTTKYNSSVAIPKNLGDKLLGHTIFVNRIFEGIDNDSSRVEIKAGTKVTIANTALMSQQLKFSIASPEYGSVIPRSSVIPAQVVVFGTPGTEVHGCWMLNSEPMGFFAEKIKEHGQVHITTSDKAFALKEGVNSISVQLISPEKITSEPIEYVVAMAPIEIPVLLSPKKTAVFRKTVSNPPTFRWSMVPGAISYKIAVGKSKNLTEWVSVDNNYHTPSWVKWGEYGSGTLYWSVKAVFAGNKEGKPAEPDTFTISAYN